MTDLIRPGDAVLYMKVGTHASEPLDEIVERKRREIRESGYSLWGYGGNTCHPRTMVQPFAARHASAGRVIRLCMQPMESKHFADRIRADEYSVDGKTWEPVPEAINVVGSRYGLRIRTLEEVDLKLDLEKTEVGVGRSKGRRGRAYIQGRVDKACLEVVDDGHDNDDQGIFIRLIAEMEAPYAVFLRTRLERRPVKNQVGSAPLEVADVAAQALGVQFAALPTAL